MKFLQLLFVPFISLVVATISVKNIQAQSIYATTSVKLDSTTFFLDSSVVYVNERLPKLKKVDADSNIYVVYEMRQVRLASSNGNQKDEVNILRLYSDKTAKVIKTKLKDGKEYRSEMDVSEFYFVLNDKIEKLQYAFYKQELPGLAPSNLADRKCTVWYLFNRNRVVAGVMTFDLPAIAFAENDKNFPGKSWQPLVSLDVYRMAQEQR